MATAKQRAAVHNATKNGGKISKAMVAAGYSKNTAHTPQKLTQSKGFKEVAQEYGLTESFLVKALVSDIKKKPKNRKAELELGFKVLGIGNTPDQPTGNTYNTFIQQNNLNPNAPDAKVLVDNVLDTLMQKTKRKEKNA